MTEFGDELRRLLAQRGISLSAAAREARCSKGYLPTRPTAARPLPPGSPRAWTSCSAQAAHSPRTPWVPRADSNGADSAFSQDAVGPVNAAVRDLLSHAPEGVHAGRTISPSQPDPPRSADRDNQDNAEDVIHVLSRIQKLNKSINPEIIGRLHDDLSQTITGYEQLDHANLAPALNEATRLDRCTS